MDVTTIVCWTFAGRGRRLLPFPNVQLRQAGHARAMDRAHFAWHGRAVSYLVAYTDVCLSRPWSCPDWLGIVPASTHDQRRILRSLAGWLAIRAGTNWLFPDGRQYGRKAHFHVVHRFPITIPMKYSIARLHLLKVGRVPPHLSGGGLD
jgi:hypothetical protein